MAKSSYEVVVIHQGRENDYYEFWKNGAEKNASGEQLHSALVGFVEIVDANNAKEAMAIVRKKYPGRQIDVKATSRLG